MNVIHHHARPVNRFEIDEAAVTLGNQIAEKRVLEIEHVCTNEHITYVEKMLRIRNILERG